jgi:putative toxin-antitoxin system protein
MNALRQEAFRMMETMPDEGMAEMIRYMTEYKRRLAEREQRILANRRAFDDLMSLCKFIPARDEKKELEESREERFGNAYMD